MPAHQHLPTVGHTGAVTADERIQRIDTMHQPGFPQELQRAINRRGLNRSSSAFGQRLQQVVSPYRAVPSPDEFQYAAA